MLEGSHPTKLTSGHISVRSTSLVLYHPTASMTGFSCHANSVNWLIPVSNVRYMLEMPETKNCDAAKKSMTLRQIIGLWQGVLCRMTALLLALCRKRSRVLTCAVSGAGECRPGMHSPRPALRCAACWPQHFQPGTPIRSPPSRRMLPCSSVKGQAGWLTLCFYTG